MKITTLDILRSCREISTTKTATICETQRETEVTTQETTIAEIDTATLLPTVLTVTLINTGETTLIEKIEKKIGDHTISTKEIEIPPQQNTHIDTYTLEDITPYKLEIKIRTTQDRGRAKIIIKTVTVN